MTPNLHIILLACVCLAACADAKTNKGQPAPVPPNNGTDEPEQPVDGDGDGFSDAVDCDDASAAISPGAPELCDGVDNDCDERIDEGLLPLFPDADEDGFGDATATGDCGLAAGLADNTDCDDTNASIHPNAPEICNGGTDDNCDALADDDDPNVQPLTWHRDADEDTFGDPQTTAAACLQPEGFVADDTDCDDTSAANAPDATEVCDGLDNDCDDATDEDLPLFYIDGDRDTFGDRDDPGSCDPEGRVDNNLDCNDMSSATHPDAPEICNDGHDDNCDTLADDDDPNVQGHTWHRDADEDSFGDPLDTTTACIQPDGFVADDTDCNDALFEINPDAQEICNDGTDDNCDGIVDDDDPDTARITFFVDGDGDQYGNDDLTIEACVPPEGYALQGGDCNDDNALVSPGLPEIPGDGLDNNCDGQERPPIACEGIQVPGDYSSLGQATGALGNSNQLQTICLGAGNFSGNITIGHNLAIVGQGPERTRYNGNITVVPGRYDGRDTPQVVIRGMSTGRIHITDNGPIYQSTLSDLIVEGGVFVERNGGGTPHVTVERSDIVADITQGAVYVYDYSRFPDTRMSIIVRDCHLHGSRAGFHMASGGTNINNNHRVVNRVQVYNNTMADNRYGILLGINLTNGIWSFNNNLFIDNGTGVNQYGSPSSLSRSHNAYFGNNRNLENDATFGDNRITDDPMLDTDFTPPRPMTGSPLIGAGSPNHRSETDFWGQTRTTPPTIGAVEALPEE